jgi:Fe-S cluster biosynthesis and repair protein YggX
MSDNNYNRRDNDMLPDELKKLHKEAIKEAISEWLDKQFMAFGKWSLRGLASAGLVMFLYGYAASHGWNIK